MRGAGRYTGDLDRRLVDEAPDPFLCRLEALDHGMRRCREMGGRVAAGRAVTAADVAAAQASPQVDPAPTGREALDAPVPARGGTGVQFGQVLTGHVDSFALLG